MKVAIAVPTYRNTFLQRPGAKLYQFPARPRPTRWLNLDAAPGARVAANSARSIERGALPAILKNRRAYQRLAQLVELAETGTPLGRAVEIGTYAAQLALIAMSAVQNGAWRMPTGPAGWAKVAEYPGGSAPDTAYSYVSALSPTTIGFINSGLTGQALSGPFPLPTSTVFTAVQGMIFYKWNPLTGPWGTPTARYDARTGFSRAVSYPSVPELSPRASEGARTLPGPAYTPVPNVPLELPAVTGDIGFDLLPNGSVRILSNPRGKPPRDTQEGKKRNARLAKILMRAAHHLSEFYEFNAAAAKALGYKGEYVDGHYELTMYDTIKWLWWEGNIDRLSWDQITQIRQQQDVLDRMQGKFHQQLADMYKQKNNAYGTHDGLSIDRGPAL